VIHVIALFVMLRYMNLNIYSVLYSNIIFALVVCILNAFSIRRNIFYQQEYRKTFIVPAIASIIMAFGAYAIWYVLHLVFGNSIATIIAIIFGVVIYLISMVAFRGLTEDELKKVPKGDLLISVFHKMGLLR
jgi:stage V sporulation protein B